MPVSRQKVKRVISKTGVTLEKCWCRKCMKMKNPGEFFEAVDTYLDANGKMSICRTCIAEIFSGIYKNEHDIDKTILRMCRMLNVRYDETAIKALHQHVKTMVDNGKDTDNFFGIYKTKLVAVQKTSLTNRTPSVDLTFIEPSTAISTNDIDEDDEDFDIKQFWGENFLYEDYIFLEKELSEWKKTHKCDTKAEESLLKELCYKELEIRKARVENRSTAALVKEKQDLMKTASVDPAKTAMAGGGLSQDTFSSFVKIIENTEPAEFYKDKQLFKDYDNIEWYFKKFVLRPLKNFLTQSRDFNVEDDDEEDDFPEDDNGDITTSLQE